MTRYPLLVLPELLKEKSDAALSHLQRQEAIHQQSKALLSLAA
jgi:hypothetical protein